MFIFIILLVTVISLIAAIYQGIHNAFSRRYFRPLEKGWTVWPSVLVAIVASLLIIAWSLFRNKEPELMYMKLNNEVEHRHIYIDRLGSKDDNEHRQIYVDRLGSKDDNEHRQIYVDSLGSNDDDDNRISSIKKDISEDNYKDISEGNYVEGNNMVIEEPDVPETTSYSIVPKPDPVEKPRDETDMAVPGPAKEDMASTELSTAGNNDRSAASDWSRMNDSLVKSNMHLKDELVKSQNRNKSQIKSPKRLPNMIASTIVKEIPDTMEYEKTYHILVHAIRARTKPDPGQDGSAPTSYNLLLGPTLKVVPIRVDSTDFDIIFLTSTEQGLLDKTQTTWEWKITPANYGQLELYLNLSTKMNSTDFRDTTINHPVFVKATNVQIAKHYGKKMWGWLLGGSMAVIASLMGIKWRRANNEKTGK